MKFKTLVLIAARLLIFSTGLNAQGVCNLYNTAGTYLTTISGWATVGMVNGVPIFAPVKGVGTTTIDTAGNFSGTIISVVAGAPSTIPTTGSIDVTADCKITAKASCSAGCQWTAAGVFINNTREANLVFTSQTSGGQSAPLTASLDMKRIGN